MMRRSTTYIPGVNESQPPDINMKPKHSPSMQPPRSNAPLNPQDQPNTNEQGGKKLSSMSEAPKASLDPVTDIVDDTSDIL